MSSRHGRALGVVAALAGPALFALAGPARPVALTGSRGAGDCHAGRLRVGEPGPVSAACPPALAAVPALRVGASGDELADVCPLPRQAGHLVPECPCR